MSEQRSTDYAALLKRSLVAIDQLERKVAAAERARTEPIAIVGVGCRFPAGADTPDAFWDRLHRGVDAVTEVPKERWDINQYFDPNPDAVGKTYTRWGGFIGDVRTFDAAFFGISPREAIGMDPQHRLLLEVTWEALEHAGIAPSALVGSQTAVYVGITTHDFMLRLAETIGVRHGDAYTSPGTVHSAAVGRLSYVFGLHGPNAPIDTACSSSLVAMHWAVQSLRLGEADLALAGGVNLTLTVDGSVLTSRARMMSFDGRCKTFDAAADGYVRGEGCGILVLKRLSDARRDGDRVLALIRGSAVNQDGRSSGMSAPNGLAQEAVIRAALANARLNPDDIDYVEAHGTGTPLGDPIEVRAINQVYGQRPADAPLRIGSVKTNIGHLEAAAGVAGVIKTVLALQQRCIPPHLHLREPNPLIDWEQYPIVVPTQPTEWRSGSAPRRAAVSSFGFSGTNAHVVLEEAPEEPLPAGRQETLQLLVLSAQSPAALRALTERYASLLASPDAPAWNDVAAVAAHGRSHMPERLAVVAASAREAQAKLAGFAAGATQPGVARGSATGGTAPELVFLFTGQGAQYAGMAGRLFDTQPRFREVLQECDRLLAPFLPRGLLTVLFGSADVAALVNETAYTQPALFAVEYALAELWRSWGVEPTAVIGHSVGELVAACVAGVFSLEDGLRLVAERGRLMGSLPRDGAMAAIFADQARVRAVLAGHEADVSVAAINGPENTVISGRAEVVEVLLRKLAADGVDAQRLNVSHAFHSPLMDPILDRFEAAAATVRFSPPRIGVVSNLTGRTAVQNEMCSPSYWRAHLRETVRFTDSIALLQSDGYRVFVEIGPAPILLGMAKRFAVTPASSWIGSLRKGVADDVSMLESLGQLHVLGQPIRWSAVMGNDVARRRVTLPSYPFQRTPCWQSLEPRQNQTLLPTRGRHPFLGNIVASALPIFQSEIGLGLQPWLADHRIFDFTLLPATAFLEYLLAAAREALATDAVTLKNVTLNEGLQFPDDDPVRVQVIAMPGTDDALQMQLFSQPVPKAPGEDQVHPWRLHASALAVRDRSGVPPRRDIDTLKRAAPTEMPVSAYYERLAAQGAHYGPAFQAINSIHVGEHEVLGRVSLGAPAAGASTLLVHPALLDACFQLVGAGLPAAGTSNDDICVPIGLAEYRVWRPGLAAAWCQITIEPTSSDARVFRADMTLLDDHGVPAAEVRALDLRRTTRAVLQRVLTKTAAVDCAYQIEWRPSPLLADAIPADSGRWIVFADGGNVAAGLSARLESLGDGVTLVRPGGASAIDSAIWQIDPADPAQFRTVLAEAAARDPRALNGIVFLWPADEPSVDLDITAIEAGHRRVLGAGLHLAQALTDVEARLWFVTRGAQPVAGSPVDLVQAPAWSLAGVMASELPLLRCTRLDLDPTGRGDDDRILFDSLRAPDEEDRVAWRGGERFVARLVPASLVPPVEAPLCLEITERGTLANLKLLPVSRPRPGAGEVEIRVHATGLNFRDVLNALGMYPGEPGPLGNECSGVVTAVGEGVDDLNVGDDVVAMIDRSFATWVIAPAALTARKPPALTHVEAATISVAFLTARYALHELSQIKKGDRVLIHAVTGGVGMAALQIALRAGAEVFGTAGSPAKRALALSLGAHHIGDSRSLSFAEDVMRATGGQGVDIVLNSLAGEFIPESLKLLAAGGHFVEIGKSGIWDAARVAREYPAVRYHPVFLGEIAAAKPLFLRTMLRDLLADIAARAMTPLPYRCYPIERAEEAFRFMGQGKHTGKIVITQRSVPTPRADGSYLVTGGLGALGLGCARWLADAGAGHVVLLGRRAPTPEADAVIAALRAGGTAVTIARADVADADQLGRALADIEPPLRGIVHAAGVVDDGMLPQLTMARFAAVMAPKVRGAWNLHTLARKWPLDFFVMFSSGAALLGSPGQANYAAANAFMDALAHYRRERGAPALSINWSSWAGAGMAAKVGEQHRRRWASAGLSMIEPEDGIRLLQELLYANDTAQAAVLPLSRATPVGTLGPFFSDLAAQRGGSRQFEAPSSPAAATIDVAVSLAEARNDDRAALLCAFLAEQVGKVFAIGPAHQVDIHRSLMDMGMDSLMAMEMRNRIQAALRVPIAVADLLKGPTIHQLAASLLPGLGAVAPPAPAAADAWEEGSL